MIGSVTQAVPPSSDGNEGDGDSLTWQQWAGLALLGLFALSLFDACSNRSGQTIGESLAAEERKVEEKVQVNLASCGVETGGYTRLRVANDNDFLISVYVEVGFYDGSDTQVDTTNALDSVPAGRTAMIDTSFLANDYIPGGRCEIIDVTARAK